MISVSIFHELYLFLHIYLLSAELAIVLIFRLFLTQTWFAIMINDELTRSGSPLIKRVPLLPSLLTMALPTTGARRWPDAPAATIVEMSSTVKGTGDSGAKSFVIVGDIHPITAPMLNENKTPAQNTISKHRLD